MNQILITEKLYITPELKRKKKIYKFDFFLSVFLLCILVSACVYSEYARNREEEMSKEILANLEIPEEDTTVAKSNVLVVVLNDDKNNTNSSSNGNATNSGNNNDSGSVSVSSNNNSGQVGVSDEDMKSTRDGFKYSTIATIAIPKIDLSYPILDGETDSAEETEALLKISPTKFWGPEPNEVGNFCIVGHNYRNSLFFSKVPTLENGDIIQITDLSGRTIDYRIYNKYEVEPTDVTCTTQLTNGQKEITLITCTNDSQYRVIVKAREIK